MPDWIYASKDLSSSAKLLMQRIFTLSKDGAKQVFVKREVIAKCLGMSVRTVSSVFKELVANGLLEEVASTNKWDRTKNFMVTAKACKDECLEDRISSDVEEVATSSEQDLQVQEGKSCNIALAKNYQNKEKVATSTLQNLPSLHQIEIKKDKDRNIYISDAEKNNSPKAKKISYPESAQECEAYFLAYIQKYQDERPLLRNFPVRMEAEKFFDYWGIERNWKRGRTAIKSIAGCVATWCGNWIDRNQRNFEASLKPQKGSIEEMLAFAQKCSMDAGAPVTGNYQAKQYQGQKQEQDNVIELTQLLEMAK